MSKSKDLIDYQEGMLELAQTLGCTDIYLHPLDPSSQRNIYNECGNPTYLPPVRLVGHVKHELGRINSKSDIRTAFDRFSSIEHNYMTVSVPVLALEEHELDIDTIEKGKIQIKDKFYNVVNITLSEMFLGDFCTYDIYCKEIVQ